MLANPLPLSIIADVTVVTSSPQVAAPSFNIGLIIDNSGVIPSYGTNSRIRKYLQATYSSAMLTDGFTTSDPAYIAAQMYFSQNPPPQAVYIGCKDPTAVQTMTIDVAGTGWVVGDLFNITQGGASYGIGRVSAESGGIPSAITIYQQGTGYAVATGLATVAVSPSIGSGLTVSISAIGESSVQAVMACRLANPQWYCCMVCGATDADHIAIASFVQSQVGTTYFGTTGDAAVLNGSSGNVLLTIFATNASRTWMHYATTQSGLVPNQIYFVATIMGQAMASNSQLANSYFTEKFSGGVPLIAVVTEPGLTTSQIGNIEGTTPAQGPNGNLFLNYSNSFNILEQGTMMAVNVFFDQILNLDLLASNIQYAILSLLTSMPSVPQTDSGQQLLIQAVESALDTAVNVGFIAPGIWQGQTILNLTKGQSLPAGYLVQSPKYSTISQAQMAARQAPPIYVALIEAGAVHFVTIQVLVQV
jgi:hypothetical protein